MYVCTHHDLSPPVLVRPLPSHKTLLKNNQRLESVAAGSAQGSSALSPSAGAGGGLWRNVPPDAAQGLRHGLTAFIIRWACIPSMLGHEVCAYVCLGGETRRRLLLPPFAYEPSYARFRFARPLAVCQRRQRTFPLLPRVVRCCLSCDDIFTLPSAFARPTFSSRRRRAITPNGQNHSVLEGGIALDLSPAHVSMAVRIVERLALQPPPASLGYFGGR